MEKFFKNGWGIALILGIALCVVTILYMNEKSKEVVATDALNYESLEVISQDSLIYSVLPTIFNDPAFKMGVCEAPSEFPVIDDEENTLDVSITATPAEFATYYKKNFGKHKSDQVIITAVQTPEKGKLRWHMRAHEEK